MTRDEMHFHLACVLYTKTGNTFRHCLTKARSDLLANNLWGKDEPIHQTTVSERSIVEGEPRQVQQSQGPRKAINQKSHPNG